MATCSPHPTFFNNGIYQNYASNLSMAAANQIPTSVNSAAFLDKRGFETCAPNESTKLAVEDFLGADLEMDADDYEDVCAYIAAREMYEAYRDTPPPPEPTHVVKDGNNPRGKTRLAYHRAWRHGGAALPGSIIAPTQPVQTST